MSPLLMHTATEGPGLDHDSMMGNYDESLQTCPDIAFGRIDQSHLMGTIITRGGVFAGPGKDVADPD